MRRYLWLLSCIAISLTSITRCDLDQYTDTYDRKVSVYEAVNTLEGVSMNVKEDTASSNGLTVVIENSSDKVCIFDEGFWLEKKIKDVWYQVPVDYGGNYAFVDIGYEMNPANVKEWTVDWDWLYGSLETGEYRIVKDILDYRETGDHNKHYLTAEFTVD